MSRKSQFESHKNPADAVLEWAGASDAGYFKVYDKEQKKELQLGALTFAVLMEANCVRGWYEDKKTNAFNKSDKEACDWVFRSAILTLHQRAISLGANAVINVRSNYKNKVTTSDTEYTCGAGKFVAGVALIGDFVTVE